MCSAPEHGVRAAAESEVLQVCAVFTGAGLCAASQQDAADGASAEGDRHREADQEILQME